MRYPFLSGHDIISGVGVAATTLTLRHHSPDRDLYYEYTSLGVHNLTGNRGLVTCGVATPSEFVPVFYLTQLSDDIPKFQSWEKIFVENDEYLEFRITGLNAGDVVKCYIHFIRRFQVIHGDM